VLGAGGETLVAASHGIGYRLKDVDVAVHDGVLGQRLDDVALDPIGAFAGVHDLQHLDRRGADIQPEQWRRLRLEEVEVHPFFFFFFGVLGTIRRICVRC
jgi:hypothetical protein